MQLTKWRKFITINYNAKNRNRNSIKNINGIKISGIGQRDQFIKSDGIMKSDRINKNNGIINRIKSRLLLFMNLVERILDYLIVVKMLKILKLR